jgi:hypothetical protein
MTPVDILLRHGPMSASDVAHHLGQLLESVYADLVHLEAIGQVTIRCNFIGKRVLDRVWCATPLAVPDNQLQPALRGGSLEVF